MKNRLNKAFTTLILLSAGIQLQAYVYEFSNHTDQPIAISLTYKGIGEKRRVRVAQPHSQVKFEPGDDDITKGKAGFVPARFEYIMVKNYPQYTIKGTDIKDNNTRNNYMKETNKFPWKAFTITWIPSESYDIAIKLADKLGSATEKAVKVGMKAGAAYATGGGSLAAEGAAELANTSKAEAMKSVAEGKFGLGKLLSAIGESAARSLIGDHHFDIVEDETGKISFISLL